MKSSVLIFLLACPLCFYLARTIVFLPKSAHARIIIQEDIKEQAFAVLTDKCNVCHITKKKTDVFTFENMDSLAVDIHKQVFLKHKMPKGRKVKLTEEEKKALENWLLTIIDDSNFTDR